MCTELGLSCVLSSLANVTEVVKPKGRGGGSKKAPAKVWIWIQIRFYIEKFLFFVITSHLLIHLHSIPIISAGKICCC